ncbi:MAG: alpha-mannosidase [Clostridia bacterium]|nr:alpha-mannosidase [Clostridia bacterium]
MKDVYLIGNAHLDPVWLWQWQEGFAEIKATFKSALDRMREFPDFKFTSACAAYYMWIEKSDPAMFAEIQKRVREGRWSVAGGWYIQPDCNLPSGESFARHALISQRYFKEKFGVIAKTGYNVDSFGHNGNIPQMLKKSRMENYVFMRPMPHEKDLPASLFDWESADKSRVRAYRIPFNYAIDVENFAQFKKVAALADKHEMMAFFGVGNHGGGATVELLSKMEKELGEGYVYSTPDEYFEKVKSVSVPVVCGDLQYHAKGCYSAQSEIKKNNTKAEKMLFEAEAYSVLSEKLMNTPYPEKELKRAWERALFNQFHDILGGCSIKEAYDDARMTHGESMSIAAVASNFALQQISWNIDTLRGKELEVYKRSWPPAPSWKSAEDVGTPVVVFNPDAFETERVVFVREDPTYMTDEEGNEIPIQAVRDSKTNKGFKTKTAFCARVPALGYRVYRMFFEKPAKEYKSRLYADEKTLENGVIKVTFAENGEIKELLKNGKTVLKNTKTVLIVETECDTWAHGVKRFKKTVDAEVKGCVTVLEKGPVRATVRATQTVGGSTLIRDYSLSENSDEVEVRAKIDFHEKHKMLKICFDAPEKAEKTICEIPFGFIERPADGDEQVCLNYASYSGIGVASDGVHSFDAEENTLSLTLLRGAIFADHFGERDSLCEYTEQGEHALKYVIFGYSSPSDAAVRARKLLCEPTVLVETFHKGALKTEYSGVKVSEKNIIVSAVKKQADGRGTVLRAYEADGRDTRAEIELFGKKYAAVFKPYEIKTIVFDCDVKETDFLEIL